MPSNDQSKRPATSDSRPAKSTQSAASKTAGSGVKEQPGVSTIGPRTTGSVVTRRQSRARERALARKRRNNTIGAVLAAIVIVAAFVLLLKSLHGAKAKTAGAGTGCPTATVVNGPTAVQTPSATPPAVPASAKTVSGDQGLQYIDITPGCGTAVQQGDTVNVIYSGWLQSSGKLFDSSLNHLDQMPNGVFNVQNIGQAQLIQGWNTGIIGMKPGMTRRLIIPPALGYGAAGSPPTIPANATLIFDITLVSIG
jgi:peptidylprolyl isomerase